MYASLLATKISLPEHLHAVVPRARLTGTLESGVVRHRLTVVSAPAGYGKTTLLAHWARTTTPVAWLSLGEGDNDPERFLRYLFAAWERIQPALAGGPLDLLLGSQSPDTEAVLSAFLNAAAQLEADQVIVLDDYHLIQEAAIHEALAFVLDHLPPRLHFVLGTRAEPPLPLARYRARGQLLELEAADLRFSLAEAAGFLNDSLQAAVPAAVVEQLQQQLEGWAAGLQLAALSLRHTGRAASPAAPISGRQRFVADYLSRDVLAQLPAEVRAFLLETSILDTLSAPLSEAVTGQPGGQAMLEQVERQNLFVQALDDERVWFRYHPLFADFLRHELSQRPAGDVAALHRRAAAWLAEHDLPEPAFEHAIKGRDRDRVIQIAEVHMLVKLVRGEYRVLQHWLALLPEDWYLGYPLFGLVRTGLLAFGGAFDAAVRCIDEVEQRLTREPGAAEQWQMARVKAIRCALACTYRDVPQAEYFAGQALRDLRQEDYYFHGMIHGSLGDSYRRVGRWEDAKARYHLALEHSRHSHRFMRVPALGGLADLYLRQGRLSQAAHYWREALAVVQDEESWGSMPLPVVGWVYIRLGAILYEWNQLGEASAHLVSGLERAELGEDVLALIAGYLSAGRLKLTEGALDAASDYLARARPLVEKAQFPDWAARFQRLQVEIWLAQDQLPAALDWAEARLAAGFEGQPESEPAQLAVARVLIARGDAPSREQAIALLDPLLEAAQAEGRLSIAIEALALQALTRLARGQRADALVLLERALALAEPEGYARLFADLGLPLGRLFQEAHARGVLPAYSQRLLDAFRLAGTSAGQTGLPEPLTERELEVLRLLAAGLTNREIAEKLVISTETVKKHTGNIYGKLSAGNRTEAVARARELDLLTAG